MIDRLSINDENIEFTVLKCILMSEKLHPEIYKLNADDFYSHKMKSLFKFMQSSIEGGINIEYSMLPINIKTDSYYYPLMELVPIVAGFVTYFKQLKDISNKRYLQKIARDMQVHIEEGRDSTEIKNIMTSEVEQLYTTAESNSTQNEEVDKEFLERMVDKSVPFIESGFADIDDCIGGFMPSTFTVIAGAPTIGKTTLILNMVNHVCRKLKKNVLFVSLEMSYIQLQAKLISSLTTINSRKLINPREVLNSDDMNKINEGRDIISRYKLYRMGDKDTTTGTIEEELRTIGNIDIIFIDYLQLMKPRYFINSRYDRITQVSNELKRLSRKFSIPVVCVASINRAAATRSSKKPQLSDLRDSGNIEYDVDTALLLHRESEVREYNPNKDKVKDDFFHEAEVHVAKNRFGKTDINIQLWFEPEFSRFRNIARPTPEPIQVDLESLREES